jgi:RNA polymerase sigma-70 factor, ECF subfamily
MAQQDDDGALLIRALAGEREATTKLVRRLRPPIQAELAHLLLRVAPAQGRSARQELEDLVQEVFIALFDRGKKLLSSWDPARGRSLESYVRLVARSRALDVLRSRRRSPWQTEPMDHDQIEELAEPAAPQQAERAVAREKLIALQRALPEMLSSRDFSLFVALFVEERPPADVAIDVGMTAGAVYQWSSRFRRQTMPRLLRMLDEGPPERPNAGPSRNIVKPEPARP